MLRKSVYERSIDLSKVNEVLAKISEVNVNNFNKELQQIFIFPVFATFPQYKKTVNHKKSNDVTLEGLKARKQYNKARQKYYHYRTRANFHKVTEESRR